MKQETERVPGRTGVIFSGGRIDLVFADRFMKDLYRKSKERPGIIAADKGLQACTELGLTPDLIVGDFDSAGEDLLAKWRQRGDIRICVYPSEKDWTDTELALNYAIELGWEEVTVLGCFGTRVDHIIGNLSLLPAALERGITLILLDEHNRITLHDRAYTIRKDEQWGDYVSLFPYGPEVTGLTLRGFRYELTNGILRNQESRGVSNEIVMPSAGVSFTGGMVLMVESRD